jgi:hypothetical protein
MEKEKHMRSLQILAALRPRLQRRGMRFAFDAWPRGGVRRVEGYVDEVHYVDEVQGLVFRFRV